jgi:hypothetical protein
MTTFTLSQDEISRLETAHRAAKKKRETNRIKTILLLGTGWTIREVVEVLYNEYYETFDEFKKACKSFFRRIKRYKEDISSFID